MWAGWLIIFVKPGRNVRSVEALFTIMYYDSTHVVAVQNSGLWEILIIALQGYWAKGNGRYTTYLAFLEGNFKPTIGRK